MWSKTKTCESMRTSTTKCRAWSSPDAVSSSVKVFTDSRRNLTERLGWVGGVSECMQEEGEEGDGRGREEGGGRRKGTTDEQR